MLKLLTFLDADRLFANAGQAVVERFTLRNLAISGRCAIHVIAYGDRQALHRVHEFCEEEIGANAVQISAFPPQGSSQLLDGVSLIYLHSLLGWQQSRWLMKHGVWLSRPTVQFVHAFGLTPAEQLAWGAWWGRWRGWPPCRLVAPSEVTARRMRSISGIASILGGYLPKIVVIPHGVDAEMLSLGNREKARAALGCTSHCKVIMSLARLSPEKLAYGQLLAAFLTLRRRHPERDLQLVLAGGAAPGDRNYISDLQNFANQKELFGAVHIIEHASEESKNDLLAAADLFVSPACHPQESFGLALLEAMAASLPIVASDWNGYREVLPPAYQPYLVRTLADHESARNLEYPRLAEACALDFASFVDILDRVISEDSLSKMLIAAGRLQAEKFSWRHTTSLLLRLMDGLTEEFQSDSSTAEAAPKVRPLCSPVAELATAYLGEDMLFRLTSISLKDVSTSTVEDVVVERLRDRGDVRLADLTELFAGDILLRNRLVMRLFRSGHLTMAGATTD